MTKTTWLGKAAVLTVCLAVAVALVLAAMTGAAEAKKKKHHHHTGGGTPVPGETNSFDMVRSAKAEANPGCIEEAEGKVNISSLGPVEVMDVIVDGLPPETEFDLFVIQLPNSPFGVSWYQGDIETNKQGKGIGRFIGRFNTETFSVASGTGSAPVVHDDRQFPDDDSNPQFAPIHQFHLGLWFNSPDDAAAAGCPNDVTPFNGDHTAGIQALSTKNFPDNAGPLGKLGS